MRGSQLIFWRKNFDNGEVDKTLFMHRSNDELLVVEIYEDDIVFGATFSDLALNIYEEMKTEFKMSMVGEVTFFL